MANKYNYTIKRIIRIMDGDTLEVTLDLGFNINYNVTVRLEGIDAPEKKAKLASEVVKNSITKWINNKECTLTSHEWDKYGRVLGDITNENGSLTAFLIENSLVKEYKGGKKQPWLQEELDNIAKLGIP